MWRVYEVYECMDSGSLVGAAVMRCFEMLESDDTVRSHAGAAVC